MKPIQVSEQPNVYHPVFYEKHLEFPFWTIEELNSHCQSPVVKNFPRCHATTQLPRSLQPAVT